MIDLTPAARRVADLVSGTTDDQLDASTPCEQMPVRTLLAHLHGLSIAFRDAARKIDGPTTTTAPDPAAFVLPSNWRTEIPAAVLGLAEAWQDPEAWQGMTTAGGQQMPAEVTGMVALDEIVLHGWDLAVATGRSYDVDQTSLEIVEDFCSQISDDPAERAGLFGPRVEVAAGAGRFDRVLGMAGRDPRWSPAAV